MNPRFIGTGGQLQEGLRHRFCFVGNNDPPFRLSRLRGESQSCSLPKCVSPNSSIFYFDRQALKRFFTSYAVDRLKPHRNLPLPFFSNRAIMFIQPTPPLFPRLAWGRKMSEEPFATCLTIHRLRHSKQKAT